MASFISQPKPATPSKIPQPISTPTKIVNDRTKKCVICQKELGVLNPATGKKDKSYKVLGDSVIERSLSKLVQKTTEDPHPSNYICRTCERQVYQYENLGPKIDDFVAQYRKHAETVRTKRMLKDSPSPRKARKSLLTQIASESQSSSAQSSVSSQRLLSRSDAFLAEGTQRSLSRSNTFLPGIAPLQENADPRPNNERAYTHICDQIAAECEDLCSTNYKSKFRLTDPNSLNNWSYREQESELEMKAPTLLRSLQAAAVNTRALTSQREGRKKHKEYASILPGIMSAAGTLLQCRNQEMNAHATVTGLQLKSGGATKLTHRRLHARSLVVSYGTTIKRQEMLGVGFDSDVKKWKKEMEDDFAQLKRCKAEVDHLEHKIGEGHYEFRDTVRWNKLKEEYHTLQSTRHAGFQLVGDNIDFVTKPRHQTSERSKMSLHYFNFLAVKNKISGNDFPDDGPSCDVDSTPLSVYLPNQEDNLQLRNEWVILTGQIVTKMIPAFESYKTFFPEHIPHQYSRVTKQKSEVVGLGVITESEIDNKGIEKIMDHMNKYAPHHDEDPIRIFSAGDQLTCEREANIQESRRGSKPQVRWAGLLPEIADFHALGNFYEWIFKQLFSTDASGCRDIGTLYQAKTFWKLTNIPAKPLDNFYAVEDLIDRYVKTLILTATLDFFQMENLKAQPKAHVFNAAEHTEEEYIYAKLGELVNRYAIQHEPDVTAIDQPPAHMPCPAAECRRKYKSKKGLLKHVREHHPELKDQEVQQKALVADYCRTALGMCLLAYNFTDARRHGDGERVIRIYTFFTLHFKAANKHKCAYACLRLQLQLQCLLTPRLAHQLTWNRFVNNGGKVDSNVELDRENEHRNKAIKEECRGFHGKISDKSIKRVGEAAQSIECILERVDKEANVRNSSGQHAAVNANEDIFSLVDMLHQERIFDSNSNRRLHVLPDFKKDPFSHLDLISLHTWMKNTIETIAGQKVFSNM